MMLPIFGAANAAAGAGRRVGGAVGGSVPAIERDGGGFFEQERVGLGEKLRKGRSRGVNWGGSGKNRKDK